MIPTYINPEEQNPTIKDIEEMKREFESKLQVMLIEFELKTRMKIESIWIKNRYYFGNLPESHEVGAKRVPHYGFSNSLILKKT